MEDLDLIVNGYKFNTESDAAAAREEAKKIQYIESHIDYNNPENVHMFYTKMIQNRLFITPLGLDFLKRVRDYLINADFDENGLDPLPVHSVYTLERTRPRRESPPPRVIADKKESMKGWFRVSVILNLVFIAAIAAMFAMMMNSSHPNIVNYRHLIENEYSEWEQNLTKREKELRLREKELMGGENGQNQDLGG